MSITVPQTDQCSQVSQQKYRTTQLSLYKAKKGIRDIVPRSPASLGYQNWCLFGFQAICAVLYRF